MTGSDLKQSILDAEHLRLLSIGYFISAGVSAFSSLFGAGLAIAKFLTGKYLGQRRSRTFCQVVAGISCLSIPFGTALGVATFLTLGKPGVSALFERPTAV